MHPEFPATRSHRSLSDCAASVWSRVQFGVGSMQMWLCAVAAGSLLLRLALLSYQSDDYATFLARWYDFLVEHGAWRGLREEFSSYPPLYLYLISLGTLIPIPKLYTIKLISVAGDYIAAWFVWRLIYRQTKDPKRALLAISAFLFLPTVVMNGSMWGQCDVLYTGCFIASLFYLMEGRSIAALIAFGLACSLKPQAIFWCPFLCGFFLSSRLHWRLVCVPIIVYIACGIPQMIAGRPIHRVLLHWAYVRDFPGLTHGVVPNWYAWVADRYSMSLWWAGVGATCLTTLWFLLYIARRKSSNPRRHPLDAGRVDSKQSESVLLSLALLSVLFPPFLLPGMHERYFFAADAISVIYSFYVANGWCVAGVIQLASVLGYLPYLLDWRPVAPSILALAPLAALFLIIRALRRGGSLLRYEH